MPVTTTARDGDVIEALVPTTAAADRVLSALADVPGAKARLVGGCVRDALIDPGIAPKDIDIEVSGIDSLDDLAPALRRIGRVDEVGKSFGVLLVTCGTESFDVSIPRRDSKTGDGHRDFDVTPDGSLSDEEATARRDFTINAIMWEPRTGRVIDPHGGLDDLRAGRLRAVSDAFDEDPLRVLRAVQFAGRFGFAIDEDTAARCRALAPAFEHLPTERVWGEWSKVLTKSRSVPAAIAALKQTGWMRHFPEIAALDGVAQGAQWHHEGDVLTHSGMAADAALHRARALGLDEDETRMATLAALCHDLGKATHTQFHDDGRITSYGHDKAGEAPTNKFLTRIGAPRRYHDVVPNLVREHMVVASGKPTASAVRRLARRLAPATIQQWAAVVEADHGGRGPASHSGASAPWVAMAESLGVERTVERPHLNGRHLIDKGMKPGPAFRAILDAAREAQDDGVITDDATARNWLDRHLSATA